jgi:hypothetical protein
VLTPLLNLSKIQLTDRKEILLSWAGSVAVRSNEKHLIKYLNLTSAPRLRGNAYNTCYSLYSNMLQTFITCYTS